MVMRLIRRLKGSKKDGYEIDSKAEAKHGVLVVPWRVFLESSDFTGRAHFTSVLSATSVDIGLEENYL